MYTCTFQVEESILAYSPFEISELRYKYHTNEMESYTFESPHGSTHSNFVISGSQILVTTIFQGNSV